MTDYFHRMLVQEKRICKNIFELLEVFWTCLELDRDQQEEKMEEEELTEEGIEEIYDEEFIRTKLSV